MKPPAAYIQYPKHSRRVNLKNDDLYYSIFVHLRALWKDTTVLITDSAPMHAEGSRFVGVAQSFSHAIVAGRRHGASTMHRGLGHRYAYINGRQPVDIIRILRIEHEYANSKTLVVHLAIVRPFIASIYAPKMPWAARYIHNLPAIDPRKADDSLHSVS